MQTIDVPQSASMYRYLERKVRSEGGGWRPMTVWIRAERRGLLQDENIVYK